MADRTALVAGNVQQLGILSMRFLLLALVVLGLLYMLMADSKKTSVSNDRPETIYQREVERVENLHGFLQDSVDRQGSETDAVK